MYREKHVLHLNRHTARSRKSRTKPCGYGMLPQIPRLLTLTDKNCSFDCVQIINSRARLRASHNSYLPLKTSIQTTWKPHSFSSLPSPLSPPQTSSPSSQLMLENLSGPATTLSSSVLHTVALPAAHRAYGTHTLTPSVQLYTPLTRKWTSRDRACAPKVLADLYVTALDPCHIVAVSSAKLLE